MNTEAPIGADISQFMRDINKYAPLALFILIAASERYCHIKIGTNWCLFIHSNCDNDRYCHIKIGSNSDFDMTVSRITVRMKRHQLVPILI